MNGIHFEVAIAIANLLSLRSELALDDIRQMVYFFFDVFVGYKATSIDECKDIPMYGCMITPSIRIGSAQQPEGRAKEWPRITLTTILLWAWIRWTQSLMWTLYLTKMSMRFCNCVLDIADYSSSLSRGGIKIGSPKNLLIEVINNKRNK